MNKSGGVFYLPSQVVLVVMNLPANAGMSRDVGSIPGWGTPQLEETPETPPSSRAEGLLFLHGLESNPGSSLQTEEEAGLP